MKRDFSKRRTNLCIARKKLVPFLSVLIKLVISMLNATNVLAHGCVKTIKKVLVAKAKKKLEKVREKNKGCN